MNKILRPSGRKFDELRDIVIIPNISKNAYGSCLIKFGDTHVICTASFDSKVPPFLKGKKTGWLTAEYGMLPGSTSTRIEREAAKGKQTGRTVEIQRLIGRSLRSAVNMKDLGENQIIIDCDVIQADGGTRTAAITGGYVALELAFNRLIDERVLQALPIYNLVCAISCGLYKGQPVLDLDYAEDVDADVDANFVINGSGKIIEVQGTAEKEPFSTDEFIEMLKLAQGAAAQISEIQRDAIKRA